MRIIGGEYSGHRFSPPANKWPTRPTTDISKEALYNILSNQIDFEEIKFLDLFGGTGSHCYECISRGCEDASYVDRHAPAVVFVETMRDKLEAEDKLKIYKQNVFSFIKKSTEQYDYIFCGPPYPLKTISELPDLIIEADMISPEGLLVLEHNPHVDVSKHPNLKDQRNYGETFFSFFKLS